MRITSEQNTFFQFCLIKAIEAMEKEVNSSVQKHGLFNSSHELYGVLMEEVQEFFDSVRANKPSQEELIQVASVAIAGCIWLCFVGGEK